jgi:murein DD-endopeptidase MepM/ murein hydrolase activator NlpD
VAEVESSRGVDLVVDGENVYILLREWPGRRPEVVSYRAPAWTKAWTVSSDLDYPTTLCAVADGLLYVLDSNDRRVLALDTETGETRAAYTFIDRDVTLRGCWPMQDGLLLLGPDVAYYQKPGFSADGAPSHIPGESTSNDLSAQANKNLVSSPPVSEPAWDRLHGLTMPIAGMDLLQRLNSLPGAPRHYRYGVHQGTDFYAFPDGTTVTTSTEVLAARDGVVIRADWDYQSPTQAQMDEWLATCRQEGYTPEEILDHLRGRQVWLDHGDGLITRYVHLSGIADGLEVGQRVAQGQVIGTVGNSGTPESLYNPNGEVHLHFEIWLDDRYVGQYLSTVEVRRLLSKVLR